MEKNANFVEEMAIFKKQFKDKINWEQVHRVLVG
jgi:hypothetical protein